MQWPSDDRDLRHAHLRQRALIAEDAAGVVAVGEEIGLQRQEAARAVAEVHDRQPVLDRDVERAHDLLDRQRVPRAALHRSVVGLNDHFAPADDADAGHLPGARHLAVVGHVGGERRELEERRAGIEQQREPVADEELSLARETLEVALRAAGPRLLLAAAKLGDEPPVVLAVGEERVGADVDVGLDASHASLGFRPPIVVAQSGGAGSKETSGALRSKVAPSGR